jgi:hypothetical protein
MIPDQDPDFLSIPDPDTVPDQDPDFFIHPGSRSQKGTGSHPGSATLQFLSLLLWSDENNMKFSRVSGSALICFPLIRICIGNLYPNSDPEAIK